MAELAAATQSPSVSSSSSGAEPSAPGGGGGSPGAKSCGSSCAEGLRALCSNEPPSEIMTSSFLSSSEIQKLDPTTLHGDKTEVLGRQPVTAEEGKDHVARLDTKEAARPRGTRRDSAGSLLLPLAAGVPCDRPSIPASFPANPPFLSKETSRVEEEQINKDQASKNPSEVPSREDKSARDTDDKFTLVTAQKQLPEQTEAEGACTYSLFPSQASGGGIVEKESPESPFEVIIDGAAFGREFKESYEETTSAAGSWVVHSDGEPSADVAEADDKVFPLRSKEAGRFPTSALLARQFSHTTAALEEVSRCVNDIHNFTNEILTWDLVPQVKQQTDKSSDGTMKSAGLDRSEYHSEIPVVNLRVNAQQKIPVRSLNGSASVTKSTSDWPEASLPQENAVIGKPVRDHLDSTKEVGVKCLHVDAQKQDGTVTELPGSPHEKRVLLGCNDHFKDDMTWQSSVLGEATEADSSGDSDDTVIEDITADVSFENKVQAEKPVSSSSAMIKTGEGEIGEMPSYKKAESKTSKSSEEPVRSSEPYQVQPDILGRSPVGDTVCSQVPNVDVMLEDVKQSDTVSEVAPEKPVTTDNFRLPSVAPPRVFNETECSLNVTAADNLESLCGKYVKDTDDSSPEDLMAALTETREKGEEREGGDVSEAALQKAADTKGAPAEAWSESKPRASEKKDMKSKDRSGSDLAAFSTLGAPVVSLDLEQEQLTIRALKELGERQIEDSASGQDGEESPEGRLQQTFAPGSWLQRPGDILEHTDVKTGSDLGISKKPTILKENRVDSISSFSKTELVNKHVLASLLTDLSVHDLIFWRDVKKTGFVFGTTLIMLLSLAAFSVISVVSYLILALLSVTISFRVYKSVIQAVQKSEEGHPFKAYLDVDITLSSEAFHNYMNAAMVHVNKALKLLIRLFLVEDLVDSLKLAVFMWLMTYVGAVFNGITLLILADLLVFSVPIVYEKYKTQIDHYVGIARDQTKSIVEKIQAKLPGIAKKKAE